MKKRGGLELESDYKYVENQSKDTSPSECKHDPSKVRVQVTRAIKFKQGDEEGMRKWLFRNGPIVVAINARIMKHRFKSILDAGPRKCSRRYRKLKHAVVLVGYGVETDTITGNDRPYWIGKKNTNKKI